MRINYCDEEDRPGQFALWDANCRRSLRGKAGQAALRDLEAALLALPDKRLIRDRLEHDGEVCAVGAYARHKGPPKRCEGQYPVPQTSPPRDESFGVTYRCALPEGHDGPCGSGNKLEPIESHSPDRLEPVEARVPHEPPAHIVQFAIEASTSSPCRSKRGVAIFRGDALVSQGYNYKPRGFDCDGSDACKATCREEAVHAEQQALLLVGRKAEGCDLLHVKTIGGILVPSGPPSCVQCSKLALVAGILGVWLFRGEDGWVRYPIRDFHRLSQEARAPQPIDWQPIATAPEAERVWVYVPNVGCIIALKTTHPSDGAVWWDGDERIYGPTRWMPLPSPPAAHAATSEE